MSRIANTDDVCLGLSIEGDLLRLAVVGRTGKDLRVLDLAAMPVPVVKHVPIESDNTGTSSSNPFEKGDFGDSDDMDYTAVKDFLTAHYVANASIAVSMSDHNIRTFLTSCDAKDNPQKIIKRILNEVQQALHVELAKDMVSYERIGKTGILAAARMEAHPLLDVFALPHGANRRATRINFVTSNDIALVNIVRAHFRFQDNAVVHILNVGKEETRLYILRGYNLAYIAPPIQQGASDRDFVTMLNNRIELAAENAGYPKADAVVLCGYAEEIGLRDEILENNPNVVFHSMAKLRLGHADNEAIQREIRHFLAPISVAWEQLQPKSPHFYHINLVPQRIRDEQRKAKLAWHGFLLLALLFTATVGLTILILQKQEKIRELKVAQQYEQRQVDEQRAIVKQIDALEERSSAITAATNTLDTLLLNSEKYSVTLDTLAKAVGGLRNLWVNEMKPDPDGKIALNGFSLTRPSVPSLSHLVGNAHMKEISVQEIGKKKVFRFDVTLGVPDMYPYRGTPASAWHDTIRATLGDVSTRFASAHKGSKTGSAKDTKGKHAATKGKKK